ncbi:MAG: hypothetical protein KKF57_00600 [Firmicutes bacterium]|nr:hypothetical protein [Bacillota bacterium]
MKKLWKMMMTAGVVLLLAACGTTDESEDSNTGSDNENKGIVAGAVVPSLIKNEAGDHQYVFQLKNDTEKDVTLTMNSAQFFDYQLMDENGDVLYKDSENKMYTQMLQESVLKPGETLEMDVDASEGLASLVNGTYTLEVWSTAEEAEDWKVSEEIIWEGATATTLSDGKLKVEEEVVTYNGRQDLNSIEVVNEQNEIEAMRLAEVARPFFDDLESKVKIRVFYVIIDGQKVIQSAELE